MNPFAKKDRDSDVENRPMDTVEEGEGGHVRAALVIYAAMCKVDR